MTETTQDLLTVGQVAETFAVTVRTLHHYDEIGLLTPRERSYAGYRLYTASDLERLATIVVYRRLGFGLEEIAELLAGEGDLVEHLRRQRAAVTTRLTELRELVTALDHALEAEMGNRPATTEELKDLFGDGFDESYAAEAQERWGDTPAWTQSQARTATYIKADWESVKAEMDAVNAAFVAALESGEPPTSAAAMDAAEAHRRHINDRFYDVSYSMHQGLGEMYVTDARFTQTYEDLAPGLAAYVKAAIDANAARQQ
ncbi:HTH-type transcriptional activator tipA [Nostocoides australiense Ben110]|uniref:HTH-type transcriptional activator tipA n=1 Tax=Nostocoides australiense Ben110 TaxID=1193182 RepID=W6JXM4_9MICO|nr:MerR family transcriptional regulator [Tetrasphaera australiensis]CCH74318.1 HTH-type transcriptional activator tipA [Tetrasphaera australiensis Ben110]